MIAPQDLPITRGLQEQMRAFSSLDEADELRRLLRESLRRPPGDVTFGEDLSQVRTRAAPQVMATLRDLVISLHRLAGATNIAKALRHHSRNAHRPINLLKII